MSFIRRNTITSINYILKKNNSVVTDQKLKLNNHPSQLNAKEKITSFFVPILKRVEEDIFSFYFTHTKECQKYDRDEVTSKL